MNCQRFWETMPELARETPAGEAREHMEHCPSCGVLLERHRALAAGLARMAAESRAIAPPPRLEAKLLASYRAQAGVRARSHRNWWVPLATWSAAAAASVTLALFLAHGRQPTAKTAPSPVSHRRPPARLELASLPVAPDLDLMEPSMGAEAQFIPLPDAEEFDADDEMDVVRVEVPRSAMAALGYTVSAERASERVEADVAIGPDGLARAVRFVDGSTDPQEY
jgi:hypothetical protein